MQIKSIKTEIIEFGDDIFDILDKYLISFNEQDILVITSKILSIIEGRLINKSLTDKKTLIYQEADLVYEKDIAQEVYLTIKNNMLLPSAGIDESNVDNNYVLYPTNIQETINMVWYYLKDKFNFQEFGVLVTDSTPIIMRRGVIGIGIGWCGFLPLYSYIGKVDIHGNTFKMTQVNILDSLATAAVFVMGEGDEKTPLAVISDPPFRLTFVNKPPSSKELNDLIIPVDKDLYGPLLKSVKWKKGNKLYNT